MSPEGGGVGGGRGNRANVVPLEDRPLRPSRALDRIKLLWREGKVTWSKHAEHRLSERKLDMLDVENIIRFGRVTEHSKPASNWRYKVEGRTAEQVAGAIVCELQGEALVLVSVMLKGK